VYNISFNNSQNHYGISIISITGDVGQGSLLNFLLSFPQREREREREIGESKVDYGLENT
jgi:hypothetical protein